MSSSNLGVPAILAIALLSACSHHPSRKTATVAVDPAPAPALVEAAPVEAAPAAAAVPAVGAPAAGDAVQPVHFRPPAAEGWRPISAPPSQIASPSTFTHLAVVTALTVPIYERPDRRRLVGQTGIGSRIPAAPTGERCPGGEWAAIAGDGYLCSGDGARLEGRGRAAAADASLQYRAPRVDQPTPYRTAKARTGAPLFRRLPSEAELEALDRGRSPKGLVGRHVKGTLLLAWVRELTTGPEPFLELLSGELLRERDVDEHFPAPAMRGEALGETMALPIAFSHRDAPVYCLAGSPPEPCGRATRHARFPSPQLIERDGQALVAVGADLAVPRDSVRIAQRMPRPSAIGRREQWIHIDLSEQTLVAYQGTTPVHATLVSSGLPEAATPRGLYQVNRIYQTKPMNGVDELGPYQVQEVPWTMFFRGNYALHGAYWHDVFGTPRSHGCVNVPPADARWLFHWSKPRLAQGWTADLRVRGPRVYVTGETPELPRAVADSTPRRADARPQD